VTLRFSLEKGYNTLPKMKIQGSQISRNDSENQIPHPRKPSIKLYQISLVFENTLLQMKIQGSQLSRNDWENQIPYPREPLIKLYKISLVFENSLSLVKIQGS
jgi:hypothetical protein